MRGVLRRDLGILLRIYPGRQQFMSDNESDVDWRYEYPWGRRLPAKRIEELDQRRGEILKKQRLLRDRFQERMIDFDRQLERVEAEVTVAEKCEQDRLRRKAKDVAHKLLDLGVDVFDRVDSSKPGEELVREFEELYGKVRSGSYSGEPSKPAAEKSIASLDGHIDLDYVDDGVLTVDELEAVKPTT